MRPIYSGCQPVHAQDGVPSAHSVACWRANSGWTTRPQGTFVRIGYGAGGSRRPCPPRRPRRSLVTSKRGGSRVARPRSHLTGGVFDGGATRWTGTRGRGDCRQRRRACGTGSLRRLLHRVAGAVGGPAAPADGGAGTGADAPGRTGGVLPGHPIRTSGGHPPRSRWPAHRPRGVAGFDRRRDRLTAQRAAERDSDRDRAAVGLGR